MAHVLFYELPPELRNENSKKLLRLLSTSALTSTETISRAWRKVLENNPQWKTEDQERQRHEQEIMTIDQVKALNNR
ncbi:MAG: hypothetical protein R3345_06255 [Fulvivirga sp.]|nr:hypothetical protein [Fulvivirga sp.]